MHVPLIVFEDFNAEGFWRFLLQRLLFFEFPHKNDILKNLNYKRWIFKKLLGLPDLNKIDDWKERLINLGANNSKFLILIIDKDNFVQKKIDLNQWKMKMNEILNSITTKIFFILEYCVESMIACDLDVFEKINIKIPRDKIFELKNKCDQKYSNKHCPKSTINYYLKEYTHISELSELILKQIGEKIEISQIIEKNQSFNEFHIEFKKKIKEYYNIL